MRPPKDIRERQLVDQLMALEMTARYQREAGEIAEAEKTEKEMKKIEEQLNMY